MAEAEGRLTQELQLAYLLAVRDLRRTADVARDAQQGAPRAIEITARRAQPGQESAVIFYQSGQTRTAVPAARGDATAQP